MSIDQINDIAAQEALCDDLMSDYHLASSELRRLKCNQLPGVDIFSFDGTTRIPFSVVEDPAVWSGLKTRSTEIPGMLHPEERQYYQWIAQFYSGMGEIIELGPWLGCSTEYIIESLREQPRFAKKKLHVFDDFIWRKSWMDQHVPEEQRLGNHQDFQSMFDLYTYKIADYLKVTKCKFTNHDGNENVPPITWDGSPVELMYIDCGRTIEANEAWYRVFKNSFIPGKTILIMQDWGLHKEVPRKSYNQTWEFTESKGKALQLLHELKHGKIATFLYKG
jgi:hypothetical protein